jgi:hypothetical protein
MIVEIFQRFRLNLQKLKNQNLLKSQKSKNMAITPIKKELVDSVLAAMLTDDIKFHLTGSRFWGNERSDSGWDFFVQYNTEGIQEFIQHYGFYEIKLNEAQRQCGITEMFGLTTTNGVKISLQLVADYDHKQLAQNFLKNIYPEGLPRNREEEIWSQTNDLIRFTCVNQHIRLERFAREQRTWRDNLFCRPLILCRLGDSYKLKPRVLTDDEYK